MTEKRIRAIEEAAKIASAEAIAAASDPLRNVPDDIEVYQGEVDRRTLQRRGQYDSGCWLHSPAILELLAAAEPDLVDAQEARGGNRGQVTHVGVAVGKDGKVYLWPCDKNEPGAIEIKRSRGKDTINLRPVLAKHKMLVEKGYRQRYNFTVLHEKESPVGECLMFDWSKPEERKLEPEKTKKSASATKTKAAAKAEQEATTETKAPAQDRKAEK